MRYLLLYLFLFFNFSYGFGFALTSDTPMEWIYITNFFDFLILIVGLLVSSFIYLYILNPIIVPLLFLYILYELIKLLIVMLRLEDPNKNDIYSGKMFFKFVAKMLGLFFFFMAVPTGVLVLSAKKNSNTLGKNTFLIDNVGQLINGFTLENPKPLLMENKTTDYKFDRGLFFSLPDVPLNSFFKKIPFIKTLENDIEPKANITSGTFKIYLPSILAIPVAFVDNLLYGSYDGNTGNWKPGFLPRLFNNPDDNYRTGVFSMLVYSPGLILQAIFENDNLKTDTVLVTLPQYLYNIAYLRESYYFKSNYISEKYIINPYIEAVYNIFNTAASKFYDSEQTPIINTFSGKRDNITKKGKIKKVFAENKTLKQELTAYFTDLKNNVNQLGTDICSSKFNLKNNNHGISNYEYKLLNTITQYNIPSIFNIDYLLNYNPNKILKTYMLKEFIGKNVNLNDKKLSLNNRFFIYIPDIYKRKVYSPVNINTYFINYLAKGQFPYIDYDTEKFLFISPNIRIKGIKDNKGNSLKIGPPLNTFSYSVPLINDKTLISKLKNQTFIFDSAVPENTNLANISSDKIQLGGSGKTYYNEVINKTNPLFLRLSYPLYSLYMVLNYDIQRILTGTPSYKTANGEIASFIPPGEADFEKGYQLPENVKKYYKKNANYYLKATLKNQIDTLNLSSNNFITNLKIIKSGIYVDPTILGGQNVISLRNFLEKKIPPFIKKISEDFKNDLPSLNINDDDKETFYFELSSEFLYNFKDKAIKSIKEEQKLLSDFLSSYDDAFQDLVNLYVDYYLARYTKPDQKELKNKKDTKTGELSADLLTSSQNNDDSDFGFLGKILTYLVKSLVNIFNFIFGWILKWVIIVIKTIAGILFSIVYSLHIVGIITLFIIGSMKFLFQVIFKDSYDEIIKNFKFFLGYRLIDFVYILMVYILGITYPILLYVIKLSYSVIISFFLEILLIGFTFILIGKFINLIFQVFEIEDKGFNLGGIYQTVGKGITQHGINAGVFAGSTVLGGLVTGSAKVGRGIEKPLGQQVKFVTDAVKDKVNSKISEENKEKLKKLKEWGSEKIDKIKKIPETKVVQATVGTIHQISDSAENFRRGKFWEGFEVASKPLNLGVNENEINEIEGKINSGKKAFVNDINDKDVSNVVAKQIKSEENNPTTTQATDGKVKTDVNTANTKSNKPSNSTTEIKENINTENLKDSSLTSAQTTKSKETEVKEKETVVKKESVTNKSKGSEISEIAGKIFDNITKGQNQTSTPQQNNSDNILKQETNQPPKPQQTNNGQTINDYSQTIHHHHHTNNINITDGDNKNAEHIAKNIKKTTENLKDKEINTKKNIKK